MIQCASGFTKDTIPPISFMCSKHARTDACSIDVVTQCVYLAVEPPSIIFLKEPRMARLLDSVIPDVKIISRGLHPNSEAMRARELPSERDARTPSSWIEPGFPTHLSASRIARSAGATIGVALALSKYILRFPNNCIRPV